MWACFCTLCTTVEEAFTDELCTLASRCAVASLQVPFDAAAPVPPCAPLRLPALPVAPATGRGFFPALFAPDPAAAATPAAFTLGAAEVAVAVDLTAALVLQIVCLTTFGVAPAAISAVRISLESARSRGVILPKPHTEKNSPKEATNQLYSSEKMVRLTGNSQRFSEA